jgi:type VI protein secretion system component VasK
MTVPPVTPEPDAGTSADMWQPPPIRRSTVVTLVAAILAALAALTGGTSYLGNTTADAETLSRLERIEQELINLKLDVRDLKRDVRESK